MTMIVVDSDGIAGDEELEKVAESVRDPRIMLLSPTDHGSIRHRGSGIDMIPLVRDSIASSLNAALAKARTPYVALLPARARPTRDWLDPAIAMLESADGLSAVRCRTPGNEVRTVDVLGMRGRIQVEPVANSVTLPVALDGGVLRVSHARSVGGFNALRDWNGLGINLGWRLWLSGGSVRWCLDSVIEDLRSREPTPTWELEAAVASIQTCWDDRRQKAALEALESLSGANAVLHAARWVSERSKVQGSRRRADVELLHLFETPEVGSPLGKAFGPSRRVLVVTDDVLSKAMAGPAIRAWHIAEELARDGHEVELVTPTGICERSSDSFQVEAPANARWTELEQWCEVIVHQGYALTKVPPLRGSSKIMVADAYDPIQLEVLELSKSMPEPERSDAVENAVNVLNDQLHRADFVLCASEKQRDLWLGTLTALGRVAPRNYDDDPTMYGLISVAPFGLPAEEPRRTHPAIRGVVPGIGQDDRLIIWGGGLYNWFDPITLIEAVDILKKQVPTVRLFFMGGRHPNPLTPEMRTSLEAQHLSDRLGLTGVHVFFNEGWVDYEKRHNYLLDADIGASLHLDHIETTFSFRTRILDYIWAGLPIVATSGDAFADLIVQHGMGLVVPPEDPQATADALGRIFGEPEMAESFARAARSLRADFVWSRALEPLVQFCRNPVQAPDRINPPGSPARRDGLPSRAQRLGRSIERRYRRGGFSSVAEGAANVVRRAASRGGD